MKDRISIIRALNEIKTECWDSDTPVEVLEAIDCGNVKRLAELIDAGADIRQYDDGRDFLDDLSSPAGYPLYEHQAGCIALIDYIWFGALAAQWYSDEVLAALPLSEGDLKHIYQLRKDISKAEWEKHREWEEEYTADAKRYLEWLESQKKSQ